MGSKTAISARTVGPWALSSPKQIELASIAYWTRHLSNLILEATRNQSHPTTWGQLVLSRLPIPALTLPSSAELLDRYHRCDRLERRAGAPATSIRPPPYDQPNMQNQNFTVAPTYFQTGSFRSSRA